MSSVGSSDPRPDESPGPPDTEELPIGSTARAAGAREVVTTPPVSDTTLRGSDPEESFVSSRSLGAAFHSDAAPSYLDGLFSALVGVELDATIEASVDALLGAFTEVFDDVSAGVCVATGHRSSAPTDGAGQQVVVRRSSRHSVTSLPDPTRLFAELQHEWIVDLESGSTLHVAAPEQESLSRARAAVDRLAIALRFLIARTSAMERLQTTRREKEELRLQVIQSEKLASLGQIAAGIVHELNNPLTSILAYSDYLRREWERRRADPADTERLRRINEAAERILAFTRDLISYSRPSASVPGPVNIREILERALLFCEHVITTHSVVVDRDFARVRLVTGVSGQLTQVFVNLLTNACQAMSQSGGHLGLSILASDDDERVIIRISDQGHGISEEHRARLFEPYFTTKGDGAGTGLGLPIVLNIVRSHGGTIRAENHALGAVFIVELPASVRASIPDE